MPSTKTPDPTPGAEGQEDDDARLALASPKRISAMPAASASLTIGDRSRSSGVDELLGDRDSRSSWVDVRGGHAVDRPSRRRETDSDRGVGVEPCRRTSRRTSRLIEATDEIRAWTACGVGTRRRSDDQLARLDVDDGRLDAASAHIDADRRARRHVRSPSRGLGTRSHRRVTEVRVSYRLGRRVNGPVGGRGPWPRGRGGEAVATSASNGWNIVRAVGASCGRDTLGPYGLAAATRSASYGLAAATRSASYGLAGPGTLDAYGFAAALYSASLTLSPQVAVPKPTATVVIAPSGVAPCQCITSAPVE